VAQPESARHAIPQFHSEALETITHKREPNVAGDTPAATGRFQMELAKEVPIRKWERAAQHARCARDPSSRSFLEQLLQLIEPALK
jgi:hypothetical protein